MKALLLPLTLLACISCAPQQPATPQQAKPETPAPSAAAAGIWGAEHDGTSYTVTLDKNGFTAEWVETKSGESKTWTGKWRDEGDELYVLLSKPNNRSALFVKKGDGWEAMKIDESESKLTLTRKNRE